MVNPERGGVQIQTEGGKTYVFRLGFTALAQLQKLTGIPLQQLLEKLQSVLDADIVKGDDVDLDFLLDVMFVGLQQYHGPEVHTKYDVERVIDEAGGLEAFGQQMRDLAKSLAPDPEDVKRRAANPRRAQSRKS